MNISTTYVQVKHKDGNLLGATFAYCPDMNRSDGGSLLMCASVNNGSDSGVGNFLWRSRDEGLTWEEVGYIERSFMYDRNGSMLKMGGNAALYTDTEAGVILFTSNEMYWNKNSFASTKNCSRTYYRLSFDNGHTWSDKHYIITEGGNMDNQIPDVVFGRNFALSMASQTLRADDDSLTVALQCQMVDGEGRLIEPAGFHFFKSGALHAKWNGESSLYDWTMSEYASVSPDVSTRGVYEPTFGRLSEGRYIMVMRGSNLKAPEMTGQKFYSVSEDNGYHWSSPVPLTYDDGGVMYSSSSVPKLWAHSNGKLYYIGVINDKNPTENLPRFPLCIAELDRATCTVKRDTVTVIDTAHPHHSEEKGGIRADYSNHGIFENSGSNIVIYAPYTDENRVQGLNRYEIEV